MILVTKHLPLSPLHPMQWSVVAAAVMAVVAAPVVAATLTAEPEPTVRFERSAESFAPCALGGIAYGPNSDGKLLNDNRQDRPFG